MKQQYIEFKISHQQITRTDNFFVVGGSRGYLRARFSFCEDWADEPIKYAIFTGGGRPYPMLIESGECEVPWEVLRARRFYVGCAAGLLLTSNTATIDVCPCGHDATDPDLEPTPTMFTELMRKLSGLEVVTAEQINAAVAEYLAEYLAENPGADGEDGFSPTVTIEPIEGGYRLTITDVEGEHTADVMHGTVGKSAYQYAVDGGYTGTEQDFAKKIAAEYVQTVNGIAPDASGNVDIFTEQTRAYIKEMISGVLQEMGVLTSADIAEDTEVGDMISGVFDDDGVATDGEVEDMLDDVFETGSDSDTGTGGDTSSGGDDSSGDYPAVEDLATDDEVNNLLKDIFGY